MLTRRHIRVKVMQAIYALQKQQPDNLLAIESFINKSSQGMYQLFLLLLSLLVQVQKEAQENLRKNKNKYLATTAEKNPNLKFVNNRVLKLIATRTNLSENLEKYELSNFNSDDKYVSLLLYKILESTTYKHFMSNGLDSFQDDKDFIKTLYKKVIAPNDSLYEYLEEKNITWLDDFPLVNTIIINTLSQLKPYPTNFFSLPELYKDIQDRQFAISLFRNTTDNQEAIIKEIAAKTPNWDKDRIAAIDRILLQMAITEFRYFSSIPVRVTINEYIEIAKEYSTPKSSLFINGVLDRLVKQYSKEGILNKSGRGLM